MQPAIAIPPGITVPSRPVAPQALQVVPTPPNEIVAAERRIAEQNQNQPVITGLAGHIRKCWEAAREAKQPVQARILECLRRRKGQYNPDKLAAIKKMGGSEIYIKLTGLKCKTAKAWAKDVLQPAGDKPWGLDPTPLPEMSPDIKQMIEQEAVQNIQQQAIDVGLDPNDPALGAMIEERMGAMKELIEAQAKEVVKKRAEGMELKIEDQLAEGGFRGAFDEFLDHLFTYPAAFMKAPVFRKKKMMKWKQGQEGWAAAVSEETIPECYSPHPLDIYPSADATSMQDGYLIERHRLTRSDLSMMKGVDGYSAEAISAVLDEYGRGGLKDWIVGDSERATLEGKLTQQMTPGETIDAIQFWGKIQGKMLADWGMEVEDPLSEYDVEAWLVGRWVIRAYINDDKLGRRPYYSTAFEKTPGAIWCNALPEGMDDLQDLCNGIGRAISNNAGMASGPMVGVNVQRLADGEKVEEMRPWRQYQFGNHSAGASEPPIWFFQPQLNAEPLLKLFDYFSNLADKVTGIPAYEQGDPNQKGAGNTASGLSMLMTAAAKGIKSVISNVDLDIFTPMIGQYYDYNMEFDPNPEIKGDLKVVARGASALFIKEQQQVRRNEFMQTTNNPTDMAIIGMPGRAEMLRGAAKALDLPVEKIVPDDDVIMQQQMAQQAQLQQGQALGPDGQPKGGKDTAQFN